MADCFGNPTPGIPPSISDTYHDIKTYAVVDFDTRYRYHHARTDAMIGRGDPEKAWAILRKMNLTVLRARRNPA